MHVEPAPLARLSRRVRRGATELSLRPPRAPLAALLPGMTVYGTLLGLWLRDATARPGLNLLGCIVPATMAMLFVASSLWHLLGRESLRIDGERLIWRRGLGVVTVCQALPRRSHIEVSCASEDVEHVVVVQRDGERLALGRAMGLDAEHADWLARAVRKALAEGGDPRAG